MGIIKNKLKYWTKQCKIYILDIFWMMLILEKI